MISEVTKRDYQELMDLLMRCIDQVNETGFTFRHDKASVFKILRRGVEIDDYTGCFKFVEKDKIVGVGIISCAPSWWKEDIIVGREIAWHADPLLPPHQRAYIMAELYEAMEEWAVNYGAKMIRMSVSMDERLNSVVRFFERRGFVKDSFLMYKEVI